MNLKRCAPGFLREYFGLLLVRRRYPGRAIDSHMIAKDVRLGAACMIKRDVELAPGVVIGDYTYVNAGTLIGSGTIGKFCSIGYYCQIGMHEHPIHHLSTSPYTYGPGAERRFGFKGAWEDFPAPPEIGSDVWIGSQSLILQRVKIGHGAVIAGGSVVTKDVPPYMIVAGTPAKPIKPRFSEEQIEYLLKLKWWDMPLDELRGLRDLFQAGDDWPAWVSMDG